MAYDLRDDHDLVNRVILELCRAFMAGSAAPKISDHDLWRIVCCPDVQKEFELRLSNQINNPEFRNFILRALQSSANQLEFGANLLAGKAEIAETVLRISIGVTASALVATVTSGGSGVAILLVCGVSGTIVSGKKKLDYQSDERQNRERARIIREMNGRIDTRAA